MIMRLITRLIKQTIACLHIKGTRCNVQKMTGMLSVRRRGQNVEGTMGGDQRRAWEAIDDVHGESRNNEGYDEEYGG
jgi:hypothetical protein